MWRGCQTARTAGRARARMCRANQVVIVPESDDDDRVVPELPADLGHDRLRLHRLVESRSARSSISSHQSRMPSAPPSRNPCPSRGRRSGSSARATRRASPTRPTSTGIAEADPGRVECRSGRHGPCRASGRTRCTGRSCRRSGACRSFASASSDGFVPGGRCRRSCTGCRRARRPCRAAP